MTVRGAMDCMNVAVVGLGYWGPNLARVILDQNDVELAWLCDVDEERLAKFGRRYPTAKRTTRYGDLLEDPKLDAVFIATPVFTHADLADQAMRAGKHTFVEKPLASTAADAERLLALADERGLTLLCGHTFIYSPPVRTVRAMLEASELGDLYFISASRVNLGLHQRDVSVIWDLAPHDFSILCYWLDSMPKSIRAVGRDAIVPGIPDVAFVTLTYPGGLLVNVELSWLAPSKLRRTVLVGQEKMVVYEDGSSEPVRIFDHGVVYRDPETFGEYHLSYRTGAITSPKIQSYEPLAAQLADFVRSSRAREPMCWHAGMARDVVAMLEASERSLNQGGVEVSLDSRSPALA
jgi:predicted dehydrogenase